MKEENNFKKIYEKEAPDKLKESSLKNAQGSVNTMRSFFNVLDLYITKFFGAIIHPFKDNAVNVNNGFAYGMSEDETEEELIEGEEEESNDVKDDDWISDDDMPHDLKNDKK